MSSVQVSEPRRLIDGLSEREPKPFSRFLFESGANPMNVALPFKTSRFHPRSTRTNGL